MLKLRKSHLFDNVVSLVDAALAIGLTTGAAVAAALGQFMLGGLLAAIAVGVFLRFKRGRLRR